MEKYKTDVVVSYVDEADEYRYGLRNGNDYAGEAVLSYMEPGRPEINEQFSISFEILKELVRRYEMAVDNNS